jgi:hypothetical protein
LIDRPVASAFNAGTFYWSEDHSVLSVCVYDGGTWFWFDLNTGGIAAVNIEDNGVLVGTHPTLNFIGAKSVTDNPGLNRVDVDVTEISPLVLGFSWSDFAGSPVFIGIAPANVMILRVDLSVDTVFNQLCTFEVGRLLAPAELMMGVDSNSQIASKYMVETDMRYGLNTNLYLTLLNPGLVPTVGTGQVVVHFG